MRLSNGNRPSLSKSIKPKQSEEQKFGRRANGNNQHLNNPADLKNKAKDFPTIRPIDCNLKV